ncbi:MAG: hypothetical protein JNM69_10770 [Archangium sp.]|nr:hypothetical protein [Archangium sp.]
MSTMQRVGVAVVALGLLGLGVFLVVGKSEEPQAVSPLVKAPVLAAPTPPPPPTTTAPEAAPAPANPVAVVPTAPAAAGGGAAAAMPQVELAPSPFETSDSAELQYATKLVLGDNTGPTEWKKAVEVFQRCLDQNPKNHLCKRGVAAAWERIDSDGGLPTTGLKVESLGTPTLDATARDKRVRPDGLQAPAIQERE